MVRGKKRGRLHSSGGRAGPLGGQMPAPGTRPAGAAGASGGCACSGSVGRVAAAGLDEVAPLGVLGHLAGAEAARRGRQARIGGRARCALPAEPRRRAEARRGARPCKPLRSLHSSPCAAAPLRPSPQTRPTWVSTSAMPHAAAAPAPPPLSQRPAARPTLVSTMRRNMAEVSSALWLPYAMACTLAMNLASSRPAGGRAGGCGRGARTPACRARSQQPWARQPAASRRRACMPTPPRSTHAAARGSGAAPRAATGPRSSSTAGRGPGRGAPEKPSVRAAAHHRSSSPTSLTAMRSGPALRPRSAAPRRASGPRAAPAPAPPPAVPAFKMYWSKYTWRMRCLRRVGGWVGGGWGVGGWGERGMVEGE